VVLGGQAIEEQSQRKLGELQWLAKHDVDDLLYLVLHLTLVLAIMKDQERQRQPPATSSTTRMP
jgi:hypothetical protein